MQESTTQSTPQVSPNSTFAHPKTCFGITRHNEIIPLIVTNIVDYEDGCFHYTIELNHPKPTRYMKVQHQADFASKFVTKDTPLCDEFTMIRETLAEVKELLSKNLLSEQSRLERELRAIKKQLSDIDASVESIELAINK